MFPALFKDNRGMLICITIWIGYIYELKSTLCSMYEDEGIKRSVVICSCTHIVSLPFDDKEKMLQYKYYCLLRNIHVMWQVI